MQKIKELENQNEELKNILSNFGKDFNNVDLNDIKYACFGYCNSCTNTPYARNGTIEVIPNGRGNVILQRYTPYGTADIHIRFCANGTWTNWVQN